MEEKKERKKLAKEVIGKIVVSKGGKRFGEVEDMLFETKTGELIHIVLKNPTPHAASFNLERDEQGRLLIPYTAVVSIGDFVIVAEEDIV